MAARKAPSGTAGVPVTRSGRQPSTIGTPRLRATSARCEPAAPVRAMTPRAANSSGARAGSGWSTSRMASPQSPAGRSCGLSGHQPAGGRPRCSRPSRHVLARPQHGGREQRHRRARGGQPGRSTAARPGHRPRRPGHRSARLTVPRLRARGQPSAARPRAPWRRSAGTAAARSRRHRRPTRSRHRPAAARPGRPGPPRRRPSPVRSARRAPSPPGPGRPAGPAARAGPAGPYRAADSGSGAAVVGASRKPDDGGRALGPAGQQGAGMTEHTLHRDLGARPIAAAVTRATPPATGRISGWRRTPSSSASGGRQQASSRASGSTAKADAQQLRTAGPDIAGAHLGDRGERAGPAGIALQRAGRPDDDPPAEPGHGLAQLRGQVHRPAGARARPAAPRRAARPGRRPRPRSARACPRPPGPPIPAARPAPRRRHGPAAPPWPRRARRAPASPSAPRAWARQPRAGPRRPR